MKITITVGIDQVGDEQRRWLADRIRLAADEWALGDVLTNMVIHVPVDPDGQVTIEITGDVEQWRADELLRLVDEVLDRTGLFQSRGLTDDRWAAIITSTAPSR